MCACRCTGECSEDNTIVFFLVMRGNIVYNGERKTNAFIISFTLHKDKLEFMAVFIFFFKELLFHIQSFTVLLFLV